MLGVSKGCLGDKFLSEFAHDASQRDWAVGGKEACFLAGFQQCDDGAVTPAGRDASSEEALVDEAPEQLQAFEGQVMERFVVDVVRASGGASSKGRDGGAKICDRHWCERS